ncbi:MAG TPA: hypothetical protein VHB79_11220 [Polyangiaceae bacterium]|nr:hypothetical protein [Polyangiaceae bacterium]
MTPVLSRLARRAGALGVCALLGLGSSGCGLFRDSINASPELRWFLFSKFGAQRMCPEMLKRGAPLKLAASGNAIGRFFPERCSVVVNDGPQTITLAFSGTGFAWTPVAGRVGFAVSATVDYRMDFFMAEDSTYVWARPSRIAYGPDFRMGAIENKVVDWAAQGPAGYMVSTFGSQIVEGQLSSGFTVVHTEEGDEFSIGILTPPARPQRFFAAAGGRTTLERDTTEIRVDQMDLVGPLDVPSSGQALFLRFQVTGPAVDAMVIRRGAGDLWRSGLQLGAELAPPPEAPLSAFTLQPGQEAKQIVPLPPGQYYLVLDNSQRMGAVNPPWSPLGIVGGNAAVVAYAAEVGPASSGF